MPSPGAETRIEPMTGAHCAAVLVIYQAGIAEGNATFETRAPGWAAFTAARLPAHRYVATTGGRVAGWSGPGNASAATTAAGATSSSSNAAARPCYPFARTGRSSRTLRPNRTALAVTATATAQLAAGSAASTPMIMKPSSAAVPAHPAVPARPTGR